MKKKDKKKKKYISKSCKVCHWASLIKSTKKLPGSEDGFSVLLFKTVFSTDACMTLVASGMVLFTKIMSSIPWQQLTN